MFVLPSVSSFGRMELWDKGLSVHVAPSVFVFDLPSLSSFGRASVHSSPNRAPSKGPDKAPGSIPERSDQAAPM